MEEIFYITLNLTLFYFIILFFIYLYFSYICIVIIYDVYNKYYLIDLSINNKYINHK